jgi:P27 family predicted phage terminase small subunit
MSYPRKSEALKRLSGTYRADRDHQPAAGERLTEVPPPPDNMSPGAKQEWINLAHVLVELGTLCRADLRALEQLCETLATQSSLQAVIESEGVLLKTGTGSFKTNPAMLSLQAARNQAMRMYETFGITPKARSYVSQAPGPGNPYDDLDGDDFE